MSFLYVKFFVSCGVSILELPSAHKLRQILIVIIGELTPTQLFLAEELQMKKLRPWFLIFSLASSFAIAQSANANDAKTASKMLISDEIEKARFESELLEAQNFIESSQLMGLNSAEDQEYLDVFLAASKSMISSVKTPFDT
jgi:hypothetical protein